MPYGFHTSCEDTEPHEEHPTNDGLTCIGRSEPGSAQWEMDLLNHRASRTPPPINVVRGAQGYKAYSSDEVRTTSSTGGQKGTKDARFDLIPVGPLTQLAKLYGRGAEKYESHNWRRGYEWSKSYAAMMRHANQFWGGEDVDEEMGLPHLTGVIFHAMALLEFMENHPDFDDRYIHDPDSITDKEA